MGYANKVKHFAAYEKDTSITKTETISKYKDGKRSSKQMVTGNKQ